MALRNCIILRVLKWSCRQIDTWISREQLPSGVSDMLPLGVNFQIVPLNRFQVQKFHSSLRYHFYACNTFKKGLESRERRAKRHKRREGDTSSKRADRLLPQEMVASNLLDDVTNELERLERGRADAVSSLSILANAYPTASVQSPSKTTSTATSS